MPQHCLKIAGTKVTTTEVFRAYWYFAGERQRVFFNRLTVPDNSPTIDEVLLKYKFTNAYRASDRVSQYLIRNVIYRDDLSPAPEELFFRVLLFKLFNKIETWELLESEFGRLSLENYRFEDFDRVLSEQMEAGEKIYSAAYIIPPSGKVFGYKYKHQNHLKLLEWMLEERFPQRVSESVSMEESYHIMLSAPSIGPFLAYQFVTDLNYSPLTDFNENEFVIAGPGALDGIKKCFSDSGKLTSEDLIKYMYDNQERYLSAQNEEFLSLWGRPLQLIDCQNLFCEISKYSRVAFPEVVGVSGRTRIKQSFRPGKQLPRPWYPPKWEINEKIAEDETLQRSQSSVSDLPMAAAKQFALF